jgi:DNA modification methylase
MKINNLEQNKIYLGNCLDYIKGIPKNYVPLVILDPPYNVGAASWDKIENYFEWLKEIILESCRVLSENGSLYLWGSHKNNDFIRIKLWMDDNLEIDFKNWIVWIHEVKIHKKLKDRYLTKHEDLLFYSMSNNVFNVVRDDPPPFQLNMHKGRYDENYFISREKLPPSQQKQFKKGLQLGSPAKSWWKGPSNQSAAKKIKQFSGYKSEWVCDRIIRVSSNPGDLVLIPFAGTGTECLIAEKLGRKYIGIELKKEHYDIACERVYGKNN